MDISLPEIKEVLSEVFPLAQIPENILELKINDFPDWDSLGNFNLLLTLEERKNIQFDLEEMTEIRSVKDLINALKLK